MATWLTMTIGLPPARPCDRRYGTRQASQRLGAFKSRPLRADDKPMHFAAFPGAATGAPGLRPGGASRAWLRHLFATLAAAAVAVLAPAAPAAHAAGWYQDASYGLPGPGGATPLNSPWGVATAADGTIYVADTANNRIQLYSADGRFLSRFGVLGSEPGQFVHPRAVAVAPNGSIYVADNYNHRIQQFTAQGSFIRTFGGFGSAPGQFSQPVDVTVAPDGTVLVANSSNHRVDRFSADGQLISSFGRQGTADGQFQGPCGVAVAPDGSIYVADSYNNRIQRFSINGTHLATFGAAGAGPGQFSFPMDITVLADGTVVVGDVFNSRVQRFGADGTYIDSFGSAGTGDGQLYQARSIATSPDGTYLVADTLNNRLQRFSAAGTFVASYGVVPPVDGRFNRPTRLAVAPDDSFYVADTGYHRIQHFGADGRFLRAFGSQGSGDGQFIQPSGVTVSRDGSVYVADLNHRIQKFTSDGSFLGKLGSPGAASAQFNGPRDLAHAADGSLYVADQNNHRVQRFGPSRYASALLADRPTGHWRLGDDGGTQMRDVGASDLHGTWSGVWHRPTSGAIDGDSARAFGGSSAGTVDAAPARFSSSRGSAEVWFRTSVTEGFPNLIGRQFEDMRGWTLHLGPDNTLRLRMDSFAGQNHVVIAARTGIRDDRWHQAAMTWDEVANTVELYLDGTREFSGPLSPAFTGSGGTFTVAGPTVGAGGFTGSLDEASIYDSALSDVRVRAHYDAGIWNPAFAGAFGSQGSGDGQFESPSSLAMTADGLVHVGELSNGRVQRFSADGTFVGSAVAGAQLRWPFSPGIAATAAGTLWIANQGSHGIQHIDPSGDLREAFGSAGFGFEQLNEPHDLGIARDGSMLVADGGNNRVTRWRIDSTPPDASVQAQADAASARFSISASDGQAGLAPEPYSFDGGTSFQSSSELVLPGLRYGQTVTRQVVVRDRVGNVSSARSVTAVAPPDVQPPRVVLLAPPRAGMLGGGRKLLRFELTDDNSGVAQVTARFKGRRVPVAGAAIRVSGMREGRGALVVTVQDTAGNSVQWTRRFVVDRTAPSLITSRQLVLGPRAELPVRDRLSGSAHPRVAVGGLRLGANRERVRVSDMAGNSATRTVSLERRLSLARPSLNRDIRLVGVDGRRHAVDHAGVHDVFGFDGAAAPWYDHVEMSPPLVRELQWRLKRFGYMSRVLPESGRLDLATIQAVKRFQRAHRIPAIATVGPLTRAALDRELITRGR